MAKEKDQLSLNSNYEAQLLYKSLEDLKKRQESRTRRPWIMLLTLLVLLISAGGGITLAVILLIHPVEVQAACISRDLILFASCMAILYIGVHIRGALKNYTREQPGPPQIYGNYLHASALLIARIAIMVWVAALIATAVMIAKAMPLEGFAGRVPYLNLLVCCGAVFSFILISCKIERNPNPFATTGFSHSSLLTCRESTFANDDLEADLSVSRRASLRRSRSGASASSTLVSQKLRETSKQKPKPITVVREPEDDDDAKTELMASSPIMDAHDLPPVPAVPTSPPEPTYKPRGRRKEWNHVTQQAGVLALTENSMAGGASTVAPSSYASSSRYSTNSAVSSQTSVPSSGGPVRKHRRATPSSSISSSARRSRLSTVRYAEKPDVAVQMPIRIVSSPEKSAKGPMLLSATMVDSNPRPPGAGVLAPPRPVKPVALLREAQSPQRYERVMWQPPVAWGTREPSRRGSVRELGAGAVGLRRESGGSAVRREPTRPAKTRTPTKLKKRPPPSRYRNRDPAEMQHSNNTRI
ncbi:uncharacterized protein BCR38DRAFT_9882 [Pseudomassariella vexata]|uniref:Uncharacterized protein n=1 Tax=Pseudomassariella vexata TaxID=1141098 RepID=A0A1Y2EIK8_9PEZI|nr:uncharacterized protein BCR38DRAFT_9882 [Pseudomassariella vexata]ORY71408.1 hypothetical protein BCR38DRAFT_9882 [Pseudomassariella vexata]